MPTASERVLSDDMRLPFALSLSKGIFANTYSEHTMKVYYDKDC